MKMFAVYAVALLCLLSVSRSAPLACEDLVRPLDQLDPRHLEGRWALVTGSLSNPEHMKIVKGRNTSSVNFSNTATSDVIYSVSARVGGKCYYRSHNISLEGSVLTFDVREQVNLTMTFLYTSCPDCVVMRFDDESKALQRLYLFSRRRELEHKEMEEIRAQVECLKLPPSVVMDPNEELCPEQSVRDSAQTEEKQT